MSPSETDKPVDAPTPDAPAVDRPPAADPPASELTFQSTAPPEPRPVPACMSDLSDVAVQHALRVKGRLYRVKTKQPAASVQGLVEAGSPTEAIAKFIADREGCQTADCRAEQLKP